jgi:hypothetical protein
MPFRYLRDPIFLTCLAAYFLNRELEEFGLSPALAQCYLNDLICIPFWVPIIVQVSRWLGMRGHDHRPSMLEIGIPLMMIAILFEVILPLTETFHNKAIADPYDVQCYVLGALVANWLWRRMYDTKAAELVRRSI